MTLPSDPTFQEWKKNHWDFSTGPIVSQGGKEKKTKSSYLVFVSNTSLIFGILTMGSKHPDVLKMLPSAITSSKEPTPSPVSSFHQHVNTPQECGKRGTQC